MAQDFLQAASNAAASNVSGPVDALAWLLRKAGVPVPDDAVGGSKWMEQKGLTRPVKPGLLNMAGETAGLLAPIAAAAKAPQIAKGLLQMGENAAAPRTLNPQTGAVVWHGSPHKFDKFDSSKIGTGEGAQAYGHGLYLAESPDVAEGYMRALSGPPTVFLDGKALDLASLDYSKPSALALSSIQGNTKDAVAGLRSMSKHGPEYEAAAKWLESNGHRVGYNEGSVYKVDLPDEAIAKMLDWDKPLSQQPAAVRQVFEPYIEPLRKPMAQGDAAWGDLGLPAVADDVYTGQQLMQLLKDRKGDVGMSAQDVLSMGGPQIAERLRKAGVPGVRYLDGGSRGASTGTSNYVVFPGEETLLKILERNGQGL